METKQNDIYTTAKQMNINTPYVCGWYGNMEDGFGWQVVRMKDNAILTMAGSSEKGQIGVVKALNYVKSLMFDMGISRDQVTFI